MLGKLLSKFKKDKKDGKAPAKENSGAAGGAKEATTDTDAEARAGSDDATPTAAAAKESETASGNSNSNSNSNSNGNGKPRVDVIDAMGNSVADMVTNIAEQLTASTEQLSKSRRYTNFAFILLGVTLLSTGIYLTVMTLQLSARLTQVDETLNTLASQASDQDNSIALIEEMRSEVTQLFNDQGQGDQANAVAAVDAAATAEQLRQLSQSLEALLQNQAASDARLAGLSEALKRLDGGGNQRVEKLLEDVEQKVADLYVIEQARIARELQRLRGEAAASE